MKKIQLTKGQFAIVDDEDFEWLNQWKWHYNHGYVMRKEWMFDKKGYKTTYMHRLINSTPKGMETDHVNQDKLDNRRGNLRSSTRSRNQMNKGIQKNNTSGYKGVYFEKKNNKWRIRLSIDKNRRSFGQYKDWRSVVIAYKEIERMYLT